MKAFSLNSSIDLWSYRGVEGRVTACVWSIKRAQPCRLHQRCFLGSQHKFPWCALKEDLFTSALTRLASTCRTDRAMQTPRNQQPNAKRREKQHVDRLQSNVRWWNHLLNYTHCQFNANVIKWMWKITHFLYVMQNLKKNACFFLQG